MARHGDARSPSPVGSYSSSKRSRRDDDRHERSRRDDRKDNRRRSRSRSPDRRYRDRDSHRHRDKSTDRRDHDTYRSIRRDTSRERRRSRERNDRRDYGRRSPDRERDRLDTSRYRVRKRRADSADSRRHGKRRDSKDRGSTRAPVQKNEPAKPSAPAAPTEEEKKAERLARFEAWKRKQLEAAAEKQKEQPNVSSTRGLLDEIDKKAAAATAGPASPQSPATSDSVASPAPYAGKFDPKAIAKKATANSATAAKLGTDFALPGVAKASAPPSTLTPVTNKSITSATIPSTVPAAPLKARGNLSGFGLANKTTSEVEKPGTKRGFDFGDDEGSRKKLERLPTPPLENGTVDGDVALTDGAQEDEEDDEDVDVEMQDATEEEAAAAARAAAGKREERLIAQNLAYQANGDSEAEVNVGMGSSEDVQQVTESAINAKRTEAMEVEEEKEEEEEDEDQEEVDPLDAFMTELGDPFTAARNSLRNKGGRVQEPVAMFGDDDVDLKATENGTPDDILAIASKRKKKDIPTVNHAKMAYEPFRKSFYHEPSELSEMTEEALADLRLELDGIKVRGVDVPKPVINWAQCGLGVQTLDVVSKLNYATPSSIQSQAIPAVMSGRDVIGVAKTGSGKTIAFLLPMFRHIKDQRPLDTMDGPIGLVMTPTRELATQILKDCKPFLKALNLRGVCAYGGAPIKDQIADLKRGAEIVVCTPGRMIDLLAANSGRVTNLRRVTYVVLDEADRMFDMGFEPQVMKILGNIRPDRQTVLFSATFPRQMEALARKTLSKPVEIIVGGRSVVAPEITQIVEVRNEDTKFLRLLELLGNLYEDDKNEDDRALIFVDRQESADSLLKDLMRKGYPCMSIHGGKDQVDRDSTIDDFKAGVVPIMIATSVAARGLDVKQLKLVVNYDAPNHLEDYVHRAGRTGRAGNTGTAVTFITEEQDRYAMDIAKALRQSGQTIPEPVQQLVNKFIEKVRSGKEKTSGSGFGGKGLERLDQERDAARNRERKTYKTGDEADDDDKDDKKEGGDDVFNKAASMVQAASSAPTPLPGVPKGIDLDGKITVHKTETALERASAAVANITNRLNNPRILRSGVPIDNKGPDAGAFHATLEINDFPQKARWAVTNRTNVAKILDATGTSITTKGSFYPAGKEPQTGENAKLYILVEGDTEVVVTNAMRELMRLLKEGTIAAADSDARAPASGRYNVV